MCLGMGGWPAGPVVCCAGRTARNMGGKVQEGFGRVTGDAKSQADGLINQATGAAQDLYRQAKDVNPRSILIRLVCGRLDRELVGHERLCWDADFQGAPEIALRQRLGHQECAARYRRGSV
jgi:uncharacterized protein YjbJ (UPF0337 family)